jgi:dipeptidyl aminopeptidase/acylaminoacyl peptidase
VSRGGRVDLAYKYCKIKEIKTPIFLLVGEKDPTTIESCEKLFNDLRHVKPDEKRITIVPGATHMFEEQGKLEQVSRLSTSWFKKFLKCN